MKEIPDFNDFELETVQKTVNERFGHEVEFQLADVEIRLSPFDRELVMRPAIYWKEDDCHFLIIKIGQHSYRPQFFYSVRHEYGTGVNEYVDIADCIIALLQTQADHHSQQKGDFPADQNSDN
ncbi:MAG: hypothetical protein EP297_08865 [Gammaproteobacteria bacterium]|nr:MAG: hypothetical protein EP297_08865 [Gammaproteobacteria bacterium]